MLNNQKWRFPARAVYTLLAVDENVPVDFLDEDALLEADVLAQYKVIFLTQPNIPSAGMLGVGKWVEAGGFRHGRLSHFHAAQFVFGINNH
jgi:hypothetical protein